VRAAAFIAAGLLSLSTPALAQAPDAVRAALAKTAGQPELDRAGAIDILSVLTADGLAPEDSYLISLLAQDGRGPIKAPFKTETVTVPRPTYDAQRLMQRLLSPLDLTRLWLKGPESMADLRDLARLNPAYGERITAFVAGQLGETWNKQDETRTEFRKTYAAAMTQLTPPGSGEAERAQAIALLGGAVRKLEAQHGITVPVAK